jgi:hypothetical protein
MVRKPMGDVVEVAALVDVHGVILAEGTCTSCTASDDAMTLYGPSHNTPKARKAPPAEGLFLDLLSYA